MPPEPILKRVADARDRGKQPAARFVPHLLVVSVGAPVLAGAFIAFFHGKWDDGVFIRLMGSLLGGIVAQFFIWFFTIPIGVLSYGLCQLLHENHQVKVLTWTIAGGLAGIVLGVFFAGWSGNAEHAYALVPGGLIACAWAGWALTVVWKQDDGPPRSE